MVGYNFSVDYKMQMPEENHDPYNYHVSTKISKTNN